MSRGSWFDDKKFGLFAHYLAAPAGNSMENDIGITEWNRRVDAFDVETLAKQIKEAGADYLGITIGQNSGYYCSPNPVYDEIVGNSPSKCSKRDLIADLSDALSVHNIDLLVYLPSGAPDCDPNAVKKLEWQWGCEAESGSFSGNYREERLVSFQIKWQNVIREWSMRWGDKVKGWWIDGCYFSKQMYLFDDEPNFHSFAAALRAGNPNAVLTFNTGTNDPFELETEESDYTAGEVNDLLPLTTAGADEWDKIKAGLHGKNLHVLSYLGDMWGGGVPRMPAELAGNHTRYINDKGGVVSWDLRLSYDGTIGGWQNYLEQMRKVIDK